ncbi:hypothetical protein DFH29DRAFT_1008067 [Suillus ampliporus]|nr:hypothetical protein DFH29DRAFT_1008067 [Suillus ampliporus]
MPRVVGDDYTGKIGSALRNNKPLDLKYGISPETPLTAHDCRARVLDPVNPHQPCTIDSFLANMNDPTKIQCILDLPWMHGGLPRRLRNLDHGLRCGWGGTTRECPIYLAVHPENFVNKSWAMLHSAGYVTNPHHDADGLSTWVGPEDGMKFWVVFRLKSTKGGRAHLAKAIMMLLNYPTNRQAVEQCWDAEVVTLLPGDIFIQPPGQVHGVNLLSRYLDATKAQFLTNQTHAYSYALETLRRMVIAVPHLSRRIPLYRRPLIALCLMVLKCINYISSDAAERSVSASDTEALAEEISNSILACLKFKSVGAATTALYKDDQYVPGELVDREELHQHLAQFRPPVA